SVGAPGVPVIVAEYRAAPAVQIITGSARAKMNSSTFNRRSRFSPGRIFRSSLLIACFAWLAFTLCSAAQSVSWQVSKGTKVEVYSNTRTTYQTNLMTIEGYNWTTIAGLAGNPGNADGEDYNARFNSP